MFDYLADYLFDKEEQPTMKNFNARFELLNALKNHWWKRRKVTRTIKRNGSFTRLYMISGYSSPNTVSYSADVSVVGGKVNLVEPKTIVVKSRETGACNSTLPGKYVTNCFVENSALLPGKDLVFYIDLSANFKADDSTGYQVATESAYLMLVEVEYGEWEYIQSSDRSAYPDSGERDGYEYQYLGIPFENAVRAPKIATGSYVGTGKYGEDNPNSLTFEFELKTVIVQMGTKNGYATWVIFLYGGVSPISHTARQVMQNIEKNNLSWYTTATSNEADYQLNSKGVTYNYIALG